MTLSAQEAQELVSTAPPVPRQAAEQVLDYLLYHKALIGESQESSDRVDRYLEMVRDLKEGIHVVIDDPQQKATALLFELVLSERFNPWSIDLVRFTQVYQDRVRGEKTVDFPIAGRLIHMAWRILLLQSEGVLSQREAELAPPAPADDLLDNGPLDEGYLGALTSPEQVDVTEAVLRGSDAPFDPMVRHVETRQVSLLELASALQQAQEQASLFQAAQAERERLRAWQKSAPEVLAHGDVPESELAETWAKVARHPIGEPFPFLELLQGVASRERVISVFLAVLFLTRDRVLCLHQTDLSLSGFEVERQAEKRASHGTEAPAETAAKAAREAGTATDGTASPSATKEA